MNPEEIDLANSKFPDTPYEVAKAIPEVVHRYFAAALGFFIVCINIVIYRIKEEIPSSIKYLTYFLLAWVILQGTFGYLTVSLKLLPQIVTGHLMFGFLTTLLIWLLYFKAKDEIETRRKKWQFSDITKRLVSIGILFVTIQIFLGAWTSTNYASYSCTDFPLCQGQLMPEVDFEEGVSDKGPCAKNVIPK